MTREESLMSENAGLRAVLVLERMSHARTKKNYWRQMSERASLGAQLAGLEYERLKAESEGRA